MRAMWRTAGQGYDGSCASTVAPPWLAARVGEKDRDSRYEPKNYGPVGPVGYTARCTARNASVSALTDCYTAIQATDKIGLPPANATISWSPLRCHVHSPVL